MLWHSKNPLVTYIKSALQQYHYSTSNKPVIHKLGDCHYIAQVIKFRPITVSTFAIGLKQPSSVIHVDGAQMTVLTPSVGLKQPSGITQIWWLITTITRDRV